jgi:N-methylhydantoinase A
VLEEAGVSRTAPGVTVVHSMDMRHKGQGHEVTVPLPADVYARGSLEEIATLFYAAHREKYGHAHTNLAVELITCRTTVKAPAPDVPLRPLAIGTRDPASARKGSRPVYFAEAGGMVDTPVYDRYRLTPEMTFPGPAIVEERECTIVAGPSATLRLDRFGSLFLDLPPATSSESAKEASHAAPA